MSTFESTASACWAGRALVRRIADAEVRTRVVVTGTIRTTETVTHGNIRAYRCVLADGTGELDVLFLGRTTVAGMEVGQQCTVEGTARIDGRRLVVWNPLYRLELGNELREGSPKSPLPGDVASTELTSSSKPDEAEHAAAVTQPGVTVVTGTPDTVGSADHLRIYLGAAAGVGKTVAMLDEGHRRRKRGDDVVIGFVEGLGRPATEERTADLELVPRQVVDHRGARFEEMDLDAVLRRHPRVALVDELAHTNVPGSGRHEKRWQDVLELLDAGIDVITTVNIQHLESIAEAVERITGALVRERVPDWVVRRADQIELVDASPEQLRSRLVHGSIYAQDDVSQALSHFFRTDNLSVLRELAVRFIAGATEEELLDYLERQRAERRREVTDHIMVGVTAAPGTEDVIRQAARMAARIKADLFAVHVIRPGARRSNDSDLADLRRLVAEVGASWQELKGEDTAGTLIGFARRYHMTQIVLGPRQRALWEELASGGSVVKRVIQLAAGAGLDVHIIARREVPEW